MTMRSFLIKSAGCMICLLIASFVTLAMCPTEVYAGKSRKPVLSDPVVDIVRVRSAVVCEPVCAEWLSVEGRIDSTSPKRLKTAIAALKGRRLPIVLQSGGGDVDAAISMGNMIREAGLPVYIGGTAITGCHIDNLRCDKGEKIDNVPVGVPYAAGAVCFSACPLILAGGLNRKSSEWSLVGVHQVTTGIRKVRVQYRLRYKTVHGIKKIISQKEIGRKTGGVDDTTKMSPALRKQLNGYWRKMGVSPEVTDLMLTATPDDIHVIIPHDLLDVHLTSAPGGPNELVERSLCRDNPTVSYCVPRPRS